jgi:pimeloyl-ACP methyl ester carboxylesterase
MYPAGVPDVVVRNLTVGRGLRLRVVESGPANGHPVLLVHGWGACLYTYRYLLPALARAGRRAFALDLRGHGLSDKPRGAGRYTADALCRDVLDLLDALELGRVDLIGHSLGGAVTLQIALRSPERVRRLVLAAPVGLAPVRLRRVGQLLTPRFTNLFARYLTPRWLTSVLLHGTYGVPSRVPDEAVDEYWAPSQFPDYYRALRALLAEFSWAPTSADELGRVVHPTLVILGTADRLIPDAGARVSALPSATVLSLQGAGHLGLEECAAETNRAVIGFLDGDSVVAASMTTS